jgi:hypothetical protein
MAAFEFHRAAGELQKPLCFGIEIALGQNTKGTAAARLCRTKSCPITFSGFVAPRESKIAQDSKLRTNMLSTKHPESARCPNPQAAGARPKRAMARAELQRQGLFGC